MTNLTHLDYVDMVDALKEAKVLIHKHQEEFVCCALYTVFNRKRAQYCKIHNVLQTWINTQLEGYGTANSWLCDKGVYASDTCDYDKMRKWRMKWINRMIKILES